LTVEDGNARDLRAAARHDARHNQAAALVAEFAEEVEDEDEELPVPNPEVAAAAPAAPIAVYPGMWLSMVNVNPAQLADLEIESMKIFILDY
jgi:radical SAM superfamily enzyme with C-terminal helix-hairpin-helix motif